MDLFITSLYFAIISISTVGFGDISAQNRWERLYMIGITFVSTAIFGYIISAVTKIIENAQKAEEVYRMQLVELNTYFRMAKVSQKLQNESRNYLEYIFKEGNK